MALIGECIDSECVNSECVENEYELIDGFVGESSSNITCCPESPVSSMVTLSQAGNTVSGAVQVTRASEEAKLDICSPTQEEKLFLASVSSSLLISAN